MAWHTSWGALVVAVSRKNDGETTGNGEFCRNLPGGGYRTGMTPHPGPWTADAGHRGWLDTLILKGGDEQLGAFHGLQSSLGARSRLPNRRQAAGTRVGVRLMIEPKPCRQSDGTYGRASSRISDQILAGRSPMLFLCNDPMTRSNDRMASHVDVGGSASAP